MLVSADELTDILRCYVAAPAQVTQSKMIERVIIGLRDGWATRKDADDAIAALADQAAQVAQGEPANCGDLLSALRVLGITYDDEIPYNSGWFTAGSCMARSTAEEAAQVALEMVEERYGILQQDYDLVKRDADRAAVVEGVLIDNHSPAARDILAERRRQVDQNGYDHENDDAHIHDEMGAYAAFYAMPPAVREWPAEETGYGETWGDAIVPTDWTAPKPGDRRGELVKAGALILAEIERIDRATLRASQSTVSDGGAA